MSPLNSVVLEGVVSARVKVLSSDEATFTVTNHRYYKVGEEDADEETFIHVILHGQSFDVLTPKISEGRGVRIVGRLCNREGNLSLFCEHLEFKPNVNKIGKYNFKRD